MDTAEIFSLIIKFASLASGLVYSRVVETYGKKKLLDNGLFIMNLANCTGCKLLNFL